MKPTQRLLMLIPLLIPSLGHGVLVQYVGSWSPNVGIPDANPNGVLVSQTIDANFRTIGSVAVNFHTTGGWNGDLYAYLTHSSGFSILLNRPGTLDAGNPEDIGSASSGFNVIFSDSATGDIHTLIPNTGMVTGSWQPDGRNVDPSLVLVSSFRDSLLNSFEGLDPSGSWNLFVADLSTGDTSILSDWGLTITAPDELTVNSGITKTFNNTKNAYNGPVTVHSTGVLEVTSLGTMTAMTSLNISGGTLLLSGHGLERINNGNAEAPVVLSGGGTLRINSDGTVTESFGPLTLTGGGVIDFGAGGGRINFENSSALAWSGILSVWNWNGSGASRLFVGNSSGGLTEEQLANVRFYNDNGISLLGVGGQSNTGELLPVPEASALFAPLLLMACAGHREFRRRRPRTVRENA